MTEQGSEAAERDRRMVLSHSELLPLCLLPSVDDVLHFESTAASYI